MKSIVLCITICLISSTALAVNVRSKSAASIANQDIACMVRVLKAMPGIDRVRTGIDMDGGRRHRFVEYRFIDKARLEYNIRFGAQPNWESDGHPNAYMAILPNGVQEERSAGRTVETNDWGIGKVIDGWKAHCGIAASAISF